MSSQCKPTCTPAPSQWQRYHAIQTEASYITYSNSIIYPFSEEEYRKGVVILKNNKASGIYDVLVEQLKNLGPKSHRWLLTMLNKCFMVNKIPTLWRQSKSIAILKPGRNLQFATHKTNRSINRVTHEIQGYNIKLTTTQVQEAIKQIKNNNKVLTN